jgi:Tfp pilus assembly protein PilO
MGLRSREKILISFALIAVFIWAFDRFIYVPQQKEILRLREEIRALDLKWNESQLLTKGLETVGTEVARLEKELEKFPKRTLRGEEFRAFLRHLAGSSSRLQMKMISLSPQEEKGSLPEEKKETSFPVYRKVMVRMVLHSTYGALESYLQGIEELPLLVTVDHLQIQKEEEIAPLIKVTLGLRVFIQSG